MKAIIQLVSSASVTVEGQVIGKIETGIVALCGFGHGDTEQALSPMLEKIVNMRIFPDEKGRMNESMIDIDGSLLLIPQFTLFADTKKGRRPEFFSAKEPKEASLLFDTLCREAEILVPGRIQKGSFGAHMMLSLVNDGPVTINLEN
ncbi:UNVERIFIED_CONTAM: hypothetical protein GTU68_061358 [Idotea baltica]|nr:hypothetical protein [Idotea baltica]